ncbi:calcium/sodium antiporter [candidate division WOR-3 bacterium]|nr:calcium/sodium antiporter [candidate division WOR-3 bacterium]
MILTVFIFIAGIFLLIGGADFLVRGSSRLAIRLKISPLVVGLTVVSLGTSSPELVVGIKAALSGYPGLAVGNVIGSIIVNIAFILGIASLINPLKVHIRAVKKDSPFLVIMSALGFVFLFDRNLLRMEAAILVLFCILYIVFTGFMAMREKGAEYEDKKVCRTPWLLLIMFIAGGLAALLVGANLLVKGGIDLARFFGVNEEIIGISIVAVGTSLPELASSVVAAIRKESDLAIGNIIGACILNIGFVLGISGLISPFSVPLLKIDDLLMMFLVGFLLFPFLKSNYVLSRKEGVMFVIIYVIYIFFLWI